MTHCILYMTASSAEEARRIGRALVEARLAACVNMIAGMQSIYWWQGAVEEAAEVVVIAKTRRDLVDRAVAAVKSIHSYTVPCVIALPIEAGNPAYLDWIAAETTAPPAV